MYEDEVGESGQCPGCGAVIEVPPDAFEVSAAQGEESAAAEGGSRSADDSESAESGEATEPQVPAGTESDEAVIEELLGAEEDYLDVAEPAAESEPEQEPEAPDAAVPAGAAEGEPEERTRGPAEQPLGAADYVVWQAAVQLAGDWAMAARLRMLREAEQAGCKMTIDLPDGRRLNLPQMVAAEAAVAAFQSQSEAEWREEWTRRLLKVAAKWSDDATTQGVVEVLTHTDAVIADLKAAGVWPWGSD